MVDFSFDGLFKPKMKGIPDTSNLPAGYTLDTAFYVQSLLFQILLLILFIGIFAMSVYRSWKKIKNRKFNTVAKTQQQTSEQGEKSQADKNTNDNLVYRFDEQDHQKENQDGEENQNQKQGESEAEHQQQDQETEQKQEIQEKYLQIDEKITMFQPFLIGPLISCFVFAFNYISFIFILLSIILFVIFNMKGVLSQYRILTEIYMIPSILAFLSFYINDHDLTT